MSDTNEPAAGTQQQQQPAMNILVQYIKDLSFENPNAPATLRPNEQQPKLDINVNVNATKHDDNQFEVTLSLEAKAVSNGTAMFAVELVYCGIFRIQGIPEEHMHPFVLIECPRMLFPFARQIISDCTRNGGFPPLMIDPIDFAALYRQNMSQGNTQPLN
ncbi:protein translocase subunit secB [Breoghania corrubedonensis]|uniref:Protein-export protein SecB n=1 Tax=Breoghania corrubedonensis TaxID=665038 RepID=A0A2T5VH99_9HYPH|nr:protein-export chaperone SecB [Breoghania corrubedonensis]PTW63114.1 protein translocase subunit secB [Breoghania corrubedonensis]